MPVWARHHYFGCDDVSVVFARYLFPNKMVPAHRRLADLVLDFAAADPYDV